MSKYLKNETDLFEEIVAKDNIYAAYKKALKGDGKYNPEAIQFAMDETLNLQRIRLSLIYETYVFDGYIRFPVFEPKERIVDAPHFKDKIVQLAINNVLKKLYVPTFIHDSYACIDGRGTHRCVYRIQHFIRKAKWQYGTDACIVKIDIKKFFYSIDRETLKSILPEKIKCEKTLRLLYKIIDSAHLIDKRGLPLGNTLSQISANIYLDKVDQYIKRKLSIKYAIRYMDDIILLLPNKAEARRVLAFIKAFIKDKLHLDLNMDKTKIFSVNQGVNAVGFKIFATHRLLRNDCKRRIKRKVKAMPRLIQEDKLTIARAEQMLNSWKGHAKNANSYNFIKRLIKQNDFIYVNHKGNLKIRKELVLCNPSK